MSGCEGKEPYALRVLGDSMEPEFCEGEILVIEPGEESENGSYVVAQHDGQYLFRQLYFDQDQWYLKPLNSQYPTFPLLDKTDVKGKVVSKSSGKGRQIKSYL